MIMHFYFEQRMSVQEAEKHGIWGEPPIPPIRSLLGQQID